MYEFRPHSKTEIIIYIIIMCIVTIFIKYISV